MDISPLDALLKFLQESPVSHSWNRSVVDDVAFLIAFLIDPPQQFIENGTLQDLESLAINIESIISLFDLKKMNEEKANELCVLLHERLVPMSQWTNDAQLIYEEKPKSKPSRFYYTRTCPLFFINHLLKNLEELVKDADSSTRPLNHFILRLQQELKVWASCLILEPSDNPLYLTDLTLRITNMAYEVEYAIDSLQVEDFPIWHGMLCLLNLVREFENVDMKRTDGQRVVGFKEEVDRMFQQLKGEPDKLHMISVVGAPGQGKTTLVKELYNHPSVVEYFDFRAWCCVTRTYKVRDVVLELLGDLSNEILPEDDYELCDKLRKKLSGRRFLIVLDDIWSIKAWNDLSSYMPKDKNGSRIVMTSRMRTFTHLTRLKSTIYPLPPLSSDESWELLSRKLFQEESCPLELKEVAEKIAKGCKGLPLSIILISDLLEKMEKTVEQWEQIEATLMSCIVPDAYSDLDLSYSGLPDYLKPCFLYFGLLLDDRDIPVSKLIQLWIAEGFISSTESKSLEDVANEYLIDLTRRSLLTIVQEKSTGGIKSCRLDDLSRKFCLTRGREEKFFQLINGYDSSSSTPKIYYHNRLSIYSENNHFITSKPSGPFVESLFFSATSTSTSDMFPSNSYDISFIFHNFKILKILNLEDIDIGDSLKGVDVLVLLRYLAIQSSVNFIPSSIANLWNLETFLFKGLSSKVVKVADSFWNMTKLRHVHINDGASFDIEPHRVENSSSFPKNLQTFSTPSLTYGDDMEKMLRRLGGLLKLKCIFLESWDDAEECNKFPLLEFLDKLVSLKVIYNGMVKYPCEFNLPSNLKKLTLSNFRMPWTEISQLAKLCHLEVLKLLNNAFDGETWVMEEDMVFPKLTFLKLDTLNVVTWSASCENFPLLQRLLLQNCEQLQEIPCDIGEIDTIALIEVIGCNSSAETSALEIEEEQLEYKPDFKVHIRHRS